MQRDAKHSDGSAAQFSAAKSYPVSLKNRALKILLDYSLDTGKKWQAIRSEIMAVVDAGDSDFAPLLTRQDLESWAAQKSILGDDKFRLVLAFLTHPTTLERPEFERAKSLSSESLVKRFGLVFDQFFSNHAEASQWFGFKGLIDATRETIDLRKRAYAGLYETTIQDRRVCLSIETIDLCDALLAHLLVWKGSALSERADWELERFSGFSTMGISIHIFLRSVINKDCFNELVVTSFDHDLQQVMSLQLVSAPVLDRFTQPFFALGVDEENKANELKTVQFDLPIIALERTEDAKLVETISQFEDTMQL